MVLQKSESRKILLFIAVLLLTVSSVFSKEDAAQEEKKDVSDEWQILEWDNSANDYVLKYQINIEEFNYKKNVYKSVRVLETESNTCRIKIDPMLPPGFYRYNVAAYNLIGNLEEPSEWIDFTIYVAHQPEISDVSVNVNKSSTIYYEEVNDGLVTIEGKNLFDKQAFVENSKDIESIKFTEYFLENQKDSENSIPLEFTDHDSKKNSSALFLIDYENIDVGTYYFVARDASGLESERSSDNMLTIRYKKPVDFDISGGYQVPVVLLDDNVCEKYLNSKAFPLSIYGKAVLIPPSIFMWGKHKNYYLGFGIDVSYTFMTAKYDSYTVNGNLLGAYFSPFVYQIPFKSKVTGRIWSCFEMSAGLGVETFLNYKFHFGHGIESEPLNSLNLGVKASLAYQIYIGNRLFIEPNVSVSYALLSDMKFLLSRPGVSVGWKF